MTTRVIWSSARGPQSVSAWIAVILGGLVIAGLVALLLFVGLAVAVAGIATAGFGAMVYGLRRWLSGGRKAVKAPAFESAASSASLEVREIQIDEIIHGNDQADRDR